MQSEEPSEERCHYYGMSRPRGVDGSLNGSPVAG